MVRNKVLTDDELDRLLHVPTTRKDAVKIIKRWEWVLAVLKNHRESPDEDWEATYCTDHNIAGCPHCIKAGQGKLEHTYNCPECAWKEYPFSPGLKPIMFPCCMARFGGLSYHDITRGDR